MNEKIQCGKYLIEQVEEEKEINFVVTKNDDYICRLIPGGSGFELSPLDKAVGNLVDETLIDELGKRIC